MVTVIAVLEEAETDGRKGLRAPDNRRRQKPLLLWREQ